MEIVNLIKRIRDSVDDSTGRTQRQFDVLIRWALSLFHGTFVGCTGFGKTRVGFEAVKLLRRNDPSRHVIVVVPTKALKLQWEGLIVDGKLGTGIEVWVINSLAASVLTHRCDLFVCDEMHRYAAETFSKVFSVVQYKYILGLTATIERSDGKHIMLEQKAPVIDEVSLEVARAKGWVSSFETVNWGITLPEEEMQEYEQLYGKKSNLMKYMAVFNYDLQTIIQCSTNNKPRYDAMTNRWYDPPSVKIARNMGWEGHNAYQASRVARSNKDAPRGQKYPVWGNVSSSHVYHPDRVVGYAVQARKLIAERKKWINNHPLKTQAVIDAYRRIGWKTICFCETKETAKEIHRIIGNESVLYHSMMDSEEREFIVTKEYKTQKGASNFIAKHPNISFDVKKKKGNFILSWKKKKVVGEAYLKEEALRKLTDNRYRINFISSVKSLNEGIDIPDLSLALIHSRNSTKRDMIQRTGRVARLFIYKDGSNKKPIIVHIYLKNTKDQDWLEKSQEDAVGVRWVDSLEDILADDNFQLVA